MCLQKLVFSTQHKIIPLKTNFWTHTVTYLKFVSSNFLSKQKVLQQKFCLLHYHFAFHNKNLAKKLSDFDEILTSKSTQMVFLVVKFLSKSDNSLAKFLNFLKGPSVEYLISLFFELTHMYVKQKPRRFSGSLTWELGHISGELCMTIRGFEL